MIKSDFLKCCDQAAYGEGGGSTYELKVVAGRDSSEHIGGESIVELRGYFHYSGHLEIYRPNFKAMGHDYKAANARCEREVVKYKRWLDEWKAKQSGKVVVCKSCLIPTRFCYCEEKA